MGVGDGPLSWLGRPTGRGDVLEREDAQGHRDDDSYCPEDGRATAIHFLSLPKVKDSKCLPWRNTCREAPPALDEVRQKKRQSTKTTLSGEIGFRRVRDHWPSRTSARSPERRSAPGRRRAACGRGTTCSRSWWNGTEG